MMDFVEIFGYLASILVALSLMMKNIVKLRSWNLVGATLFSTYGLLIGAWPVFALNGWIALVDIYYLWQMKMKKDFFDIIDIPNPKNTIFLKFVRVYRDDIIKFFPLCKDEIFERGHVVMILRNLLPVGLFHYEYAPENEVLIHIDYVTPEYRDLNNAHFLFSKKGEKFKHKGIQKISAYSNSKDHQKYLLKMGFQQSDTIYKSQVVYEKAITR